MKTFPIHRVVYQNELIDIQPELKNILFKLFAPAIESSENVFPVFGITNVLKYHKEFGVDFSDEEKAILTTLHQELIWEHIETIVIQPKEEEESDDEEDYNNENLSDTDDSDDLIEIF